MVRVQQVFLVACLIASTLVFGTAGAAGQASRIDGYDGYRFGMSLDEARRVNPQALFNPKCSAGRQCLSYETKISAFDALVIVRLTGKPARVEDVLVTIESFTNRPVFYPCKTVLAELVRLLKARYGSNPVRIGAMDSLTWAAPNGGTAELTSICLGQEGSNDVIYRPSNPM